MHFPLAAYRLALFSALVLAIPHLVACGGAVDDETSPATAPAPDAIPAATCAETTPTGATVRMDQGDASDLSPLQIAAGGGPVIVGGQRAAPALGAIVRMHFDGTEPEQLAQDFRGDYSLVASAGQLLYFAATGPTPITMDDGGTTIGLPPGEWVARDLSSGVVRRLGMKSYGTGVALRDGTFAIVSYGREFGYDSPDPSEIWSWDPVTNRITVLVTASFTNGRAPILVTDGVDLFLEDDGTDEQPTWRFWKIDLAALTATVVHEEAHQDPWQTLFLGADREALYLFQQSPPTLRAIAKTGAELPSLALDLSDGKTPGDGLSPMASGGVTDDMIYLTSPARQTMFQIDKHTGVALARDVAPTTDSIYAQAVDPCYVYFGSGEIVSRVPRARPTK